MNSECANINYFSEEIKELIKDSQNGDKDALEKLVIINTPLINSILKKYMNYSLDYDDLFQIGAIGLINAIKRFDFSFNTKFSTYAVYVINGEYKRYFRDEGIIKVGRSLKTLYIKARKLIEEYSKKKGEEPSINYLIEHLQCSKEDLIMAFEACKTPESLYTSIKQNDSNTMMLLDKIKDEKKENDIIIEKIDLKNAILGLNTRDRKLIILRYFKNKTQNEVAAILGISQVQVSRLEKKIIEDMKKSFIL